MLKEISIEVIRKCPNRCMHCSSFSTENCSEIIPFEIFKEVVTGAKKVGLETICFSGGEPFLHPDIVKMIEYVYAQGLNSYIYSSGIYMNNMNIREPIKKCKHGQEEIAIHSLQVKEKFLFKNRRDLQGTLLSLYKQCKGYKEIFRDGQDTIRRNFTFEKHCEVVLEETKQIRFGIDLIISNEDRPRFTITTSCDTKNPLEQFKLSFFREVYNKLEVEEVEKSQDGKSFKYEITEKCE